MVITQDLNILRQKSIKVNKFEAEPLFNLLKFEISKYPEAVGLSAVQLEIPKRMFVVKVGENIVGFMNPKIISKMGPYEAEEGCLSIANKLFKVQRFRVIEMRDEIQGRKTYSGKLAQVMLHEFSHLQGITLYDEGIEII